MRKIPNIGRAALMCTALLASMFWAGQHMVLAGEQPNLLVVGEDADQDTVPRGSRIFNRVLATLTGNMQELGFKVYDETAVGMDITNPGRVRRTDAELISVAQRIPKPPIDVIVPFQIYASVQQNAYSDIKELRVRISGRLLQVQTGKALGNFELAVGPRGLKPLPVNCNRDCILENVGDAAKVIADEVGIVLVAKLDALSPLPAQATGNMQKSQKVAPPPPNHATAAPEGCTGMNTAYTLVLKGFTPGEIDRFEGTVVNLPGYQHNRQVQVLTRYAEYWYETCSDQVRLERNLRLVFDRMHAPYRLGFAAQRFEIEKISRVSRP